MQSLNVFTCIILHRHNKLRLKQDDDIVVYEDLAGEVHFSKHVPQPNNLNRCVELTHTHGEESLMAGLVLV